MRREHPRRRATESALAESSLFDHVHGAKEIETLVGLAAEHVFDARAAHVADHGVKLATAMLLQHRGIDRLGAVFVHLHGDSRAIPGPAQVLVELSQPRRQGGRVTWRLAREGGNRRSAGTGKQVGQSGLEQGGIPGFT